MMKVPLMNEVRASRALVCWLVCLLVVPAAIAAEDRPRLAVLTDIGGDPDDQQSMIRLLVYANKFEIEALIATASGTPGELRKEVTRPDSIREIIGGYERVLPNLARHATGWPEAKQLLRCVKSGNPQRGRKAIGEGRDTEGASFLLERIDAGSAERLGGTLVLGALLLGSVAAPAAAGDSYAARRAALQQRNPSKRKVPVIPPKDQKLRVIAGMAGRFPIKHGSPPLRYQYEPSDSEGVDFIIAHAMASRPDDPLWVIGPGAATDIASAYLKEPRIAERVVVFWHFRTEWPKRCWNFNVIGDVRAARLVFHSDLSFVLFDTGTYLTCPREQSARWVEFGPLGRFLHEFRFEHQWYQSPTKGFDDLGDIAALVDPSLATWEVVECPDVNWDPAYQFKSTKGKILRCSDIDRDRTFELFESRLKP